MQTSCRLKSDFTLLAKGYYMKIIAIQQDVPGITDEQFMPYVKPETLRVWALMQANVLREIHQTQEGYGHVLTFECASVEEAKGYIASLPMVAAGLITFQVIALLPYPGFEYLFAED